VFALLAALGALAGIIASDNKSSTPSTTLNQSTTNSLGVNVEAPKPAGTTTVTAPAKTVTAPAQTVTAPAPESKTPTAPAKTDTTEAPPSP
jgi:hypothetical protein